MTTIIVTKDKILSDGLVSVGNRVDADDFKKIRKCGGYLVGGAGRLSSLLTFFTWFEQALRMEALQQAVPDLVIQSGPEKEDEEFIAVVVNPNGEIFIHEGNDPSRAYKIDSEYYSVGSGSDFALAALDAGATPEEAMEVAKFRDTHSGGQTFVEVLKSEEDEKFEITEKELMALTKRQIINLVLTGDKDVEPSRDQDFSE